MRNSASQRESCPDYGSRYILAVVLSAIVYLSDSYLQNITENNRVTMLESGF